MVTSVEQSEAEVLGETCPSMPQCRCVLEPGRRSGKPVTSRPRYGTAVLMRISMKGNRFDVLRIHGLIQRLRNSSFLNPQSVIMCGR
jgi:hypothetical protein